MNAQEISSYINGLEAENHLLHVKIKQLMERVAALNKKLAIKDAGASMGKATRSDAYGNTPEQAAVVEQVKQWIREGLTIYAIANRLNESGVKTKTGKDWQFRTAQVLVARIKRVELETSFSEQEAA